MSLRIRICLAAVALLVVAWRVWEYEHTNPYLKDSAASPISAALGLLGMAILAVAVVESADGITRRAARAARAGMYGGTVVLACVVLFLLIRGGPPQSGLWLIAGGPLGYLLAAALAFIIPPGDRAKEG